MIHQMGLDVYRFSIAWSRILPQGIGEVNQRGIEYYRYSSFWMVVGVSYKLDGCRNVGMSYI